MKAKQYFYNNGSYEPVSDSAGEFFSLLAGENTVLHKCWRTSGTRVPFFSEQFTLLKKDLERNHLSGTKFTEPESVLLPVIKLLHKNRVFKGAIVHFFFTRIMDIHELPGTGMVILSESHSNERFIINTSGYHLGLLKDFVHPGFDILGRINRLDPYGKSWKKDLEQGIDAGIIVNSEGTVVECDDSCIFLIGGDKIFTPSPDLGGSERAIRNVILSKASEVGLKVIETRMLEPGHLNDADEVFIANDLEGIRWVAGYGEKRYFRNYSNLILNMINSDWEKS